jgi:hypothetical protein
MILILFIITVLVCIGINKAIGDKPLDNGVWLIIILLAYLFAEYV